MNSFLLCTVSPFVHRIFEEGNFNNELEIPPVEGDFNEFINALYGQKIRIDSHNCRFLHFISKFLHITQLETVTEKVCEETNTFENNFRWAIQLFNANQQRDEIINKLSYNLRNNLQNPCLFEAPPGLILEILNSKFLQIDQGGKLQLVDNLIQYDSAKYQSLSTFSYSKSFLLKQFTEKPFDLNKIRSNVIRNVQYFVSNDKSKRIVFSPQPSNLFNGILRSKTPFILGSSDTLGKEFDISNISKEKSGENIFCSKSEKNPFFIIKFQTVKFQLTHYAIKSSAFGNLSFCPKSWKLEVRTSSNSWTQIDIVENDNSLYGSGFQSIFDIKFSISPMSEFRFTQLDSHHNTNKSLMIDLFEMYGISFENPKRLIN